MSIRWRRPAAARRSARWSAACSSAFPASASRSRASPTRTATSCASRGPWGPSGAEDLIEGTDFAQLEAGRLQSVTGFLDKVPVGA